MTETVQNLSALVGRILLSCIFLLASLHKITDFSGNLAYMVSKDLPFAEALLVIAIAVELLGALMVLLGWKTKAGALLLLLFVIVVTIIFHNYWDYPPQEAANQMHHFLKNFAIIGGLLYVMAFGAGRYSIDGYKHHKG